MSLFFFDIRDGSDSYKDEDGIECAALKDVEFHAVSVLPDLAREMLPDGPRRSFVVKVRDDSGKHVFRASLTLASAWIVDDVHGEPQPGEDRWTAALDRAKLQVEVMRREFAEDGLSSQMAGLDSLLSVVQSEVHRLRGTPDGHKSTARSSQ